MAPHLCVAALAATLLAGIPRAEAACNPKKVEVCHRGMTLCVGTPALGAHVGHGDFGCACEDIATFHPDADGDGFGDPATSVEACAGPPGYVADGTDCDDADPAVNPGMVEVCNNGVDDDCDPATECTLTGTVDLGTADVVFAGVDDGSLTGENAAAGDVNGDGQADVLIGAPLEGTNGSNAGAAYLVFGPFAPGTYDLGAASAAFFGSDLGDQTGTAVDIADLNDDGTLDVVIGSRLRGPGGNAGPGAVHVFFGPVAPGVYDVAAADVTIEGNVDGDELGAALDAGGDIDGDGDADLLIGAPGHDTDRANAGAVYVVLGPLAAGTNAVDDLAVGRLEGFSTLQEVGGAVAFAGDIDGDGNDDLLTGSNGDGAWLQYGPYAAVQTVTFADVSFAPVAFNVSAGFDVAAGGDLDDDGTADLLISDRDQQSAGFSAGAAYVFTGPVPPGDSTLDDAFARRTGELDSDMAGSSLAGAGDVNGDGFDDLLVGAWTEDTAGDQAGAAYLLYGPIAPGDASLSTADAKLTGAAAFEHAGEFVGPAGDVNQDGHADFFVGAPAAGGTGAVYLLFGRGL